LPARQRRETGRAGLTSIEQSESDGDVGRDNSPSAHCIVRDQSISPASATDANARAALTVDEGEDKGSERKGAQSKWGGVGEATVAGEGGEGQGPSPVVRGEARGLLDGEGGLGRVERVSSRRDVARVEGRSSEVCIVLCLLDIMVVAVRCGNRGGHGVWSAGCGVWGVVGGVWLLCKRSAGLFPGG
jgi:hypothetical protein